MQNPMVVGNGYNCRRPAGFLYIFPGYTVNRVGSNTADAILRDNVHSSQSEIDSIRDSIRCHDGTLNCSFDGRSQFIYVSNGSFAKTRCRGSASTINQCVSACFNHSGQHFHRTCAYINP